MKHGGIKVNIRVYRIMAKALLAIVLLALAVIVVFVGLQISGRNRLRHGGGSTAPELNLSDLADKVPDQGTDIPEESAEGDILGDGSERNWQEGDVRYQGVHYRYNEDILTFLFLGIDKMTEVKPVKSGIDGGQSDAIFLLVLNPHNKEISVIAIPRDTMTDIDIYNKEGYFMRTAQGQLTLQHGYGDGATVSCERSRKAVEKLFYHLPIHGYCSVNMGAIPLINDAVGGVEVVALEDVIRTGIKRGDTVLLKGMDAYYYLHNRDTRSAESAGRRLERQKQYLTAYAAAALNAMKSDITLPVTLYQDLSKYMVTDVSLDEITYLAVQASGYRFDSDNMYSLKGETVMGDQFEEFYVDETALYELILEVFYEEVTD